MNGMQNMYNGSYPDPGAQAIGSYAPNDGMEGLADGIINPHILGSGPSQTLDQIINQNNQELMRRRQTYNSRFQDPSGQQNRRASMLEFSSSNNGDLADFQFDPNPQHGTLPGQIANMNMSPSKPQDPRRVRSREELMIDTRFSQMPPYEGGPMSAFPASMIPNSGMSMDGSNNFLQQNLDMSGEFDPMSATDIGPLNLTTDSVQQPMYTTSPIRANFPMHYTNSNHDPGGGVSPANNQAMRVAQGSGSQHGSSPHRYLGKSQNQIRRNPMMPSPLSLSAQNSMSSGHMQSPVHNSHIPHVPPNSTAAQHQPRSRRASMEMQSAYLGQESEMGMDMNNMNNMNNGVPDGYNPKWANAYSTTGFDMLAILMRVATRRNPQINLGPVDLACAFVVCDIEKHDLPIVYCSDMFERLTGYSRHEILGRNCRFLQAPDGKVQSGIKRKYVDDKSVLYLKNQISKRTEAQISLINYRKGGQPFMNLLTMIPITWDNEEFKYFVGFQVDLVEQPNSVSARNPDGTYEINYNRSALPAYRLPAPDPGSALDNMGGATISRDEVSQVLTTIGNGETDLSRRIWDKVLLENTDDVVHVLSLKGLFLYLSPACQQVLEYDPSELVGTALSAVCHPSDIVPVTRELKDSSNGSTVNVVYRIRRKNSGYTWFEAHGSLHTEQGKGRKCIILVGRQRPVYALDKNDIEVSEGAGDAELWTKMSTTGMFLYVSSSARAMLDRLPDDLVGTSMQALMRQESKKEFGRILELARMGEKSTFKHDLQNRRGQVLQAQTTVYPGDAKKGFKPTFLLGQTRLLKMTRTMLLSQKSNVSVSRSDVSMGASTPHSASGMPNPGPVSRNNSMVAMNQSTAKGAFVGSSGILTQAGSGGVPIGSQDEILASEDNIFDELKTTRSTSWQFELRQMERQNRLLSEDLATLLARKKKRKRRKGMGNMEKDCANCHTRVTPEWRRGPSGQRDLCNSCGLRWAKQNGRVSPRKSDKSSSPMHANASASAGQQQQSGAITSIDSSTGPDQKVRKTSNGDEPASLKQEDTEDSLGNMPTVIEEGLEPPHPNVLPT